MTTVRVDTAPVGMIVITKGKIMAGAEVTIIMLVRMRPVQEALQAMGDDVSRTGDDAQRSIMTRPHPAEKAFEIFGFGVAAGFVVFMVFLLLFDGGNLIFQAGDMEHGAGGGEGHGGGDHHQGSSGMDHGSAGDGHTSAGTDHGGRNPSSFINGPTLLAMTGGYLAVLAIWAGLNHRKYRSWQE